MKRKTIPAIILSAAMLLSGCNSGENPDDIPIYSRPQSSSEIISENPSSGENSSPTASSTSSIESSSSRRMNNEPCKCQ